jgi:hypothetical protein
MTAKSPKRPPEFRRIPTPPAPSLLEEFEQFESRMKAHNLQALATDLHNLNLFFDYFEIEKTRDPAVRYMFLALCLARKYVPGFHSASARGRPKVDLLKVAQLRIDADCVKRHKRRLKLPDSDSKVAEALTRKWPGYSNKTLQNLLSAPRDPKFEVFVEVLVRLFRACPEVAPDLGINRSRIPKNSP